MCSLKEAGYDVTAKTNINEALDLLKRDRFDAVIVGHRFSAEEKYLLAVEAKDQANTPVVLVCECMPWKATLAYCRRCADWCPPESAAQHRWQPEP